MGKKQLSYWFLGMMSWNLTSIFKLALSLHGVLATTLSQTMTIFLGFYIKRQVFLGNYIIRKSRIYTSVYQLQIFYEVSMFCHVLGQFYFSFSHKYQATLNWKIVGLDYCDTCTFKLNGSSGCENTLCIEQNNFFWQKVLCFLFKSI